MLRSTSKDFLTNFQYSGMKRLIFASKDAGQHSQMKIPTVIRGSCNLVVQASLAAKERKQNEIVHKEIATCPENNSYRFLFLNIIPFIVFRLKD